MFAKAISKTLSRTAIATLLCSTIVACSDTTVGTRSFEEAESFLIPNPAGSIAAGIILPALELSIPIDLAEQEAYSDGDFDYITSVKVRDIVFEIASDSQDPAVDTVEDGNLDSFEFVSGLSLSLSADVGGTLTEVPIAELPANDPQIASNATSLTMNVNSEENIRDLIEGDNVKLLINVTGSIPPDNVWVDAKIRFRVGIGFR